MIPEDIKFPFDSLDDKFHNIIEFKLLLDFKDIVFCQQADGTWDE
jgi:hypothetical protein